MKTEIRNRPAFATIFATLEPGDRLIAEAGAMASMSGGTEISTSWNGGFGNAMLRRVFGSESLFVNEFRCPAHLQSVDVVLTQATPGDIVQFDMSGNTLYVQPGGFIAAGPEVQLGVGFAGFSSWWGGEGLFRLKVSGHGPLWIGAYGGIFERQVSGEFVVDTGHLVAYEPTLEISVGLASSGVFSSMFSGEGFVSRLRGQGKIWLQSRSIDGLAAWTNGMM